METIQIEFQPNVREKLMNFLNTFSKNELHINQHDNEVIEDETFINYRNKLHLEVKKIKSGESKLFSFEELDAMLELTISKYEN